VEEDKRKPGCRLGGWLPRIEVTGDICLRRPRTMQGCRAGDDDDDDEEEEEEIFHLLKYSFLWVLLPYMRRF
jgi:hypothetical protein